MAPVYQINNEQFRVETYPIGPLAVNCSIIYSDLTKESVIVDPGDDDLTLLNLVNSKNLTIKKLIHTHGHIDHIGKSATIQKQTKAPLYLHKDDISLYNSIDMQASMLGLTCDKPVSIDNIFSEGDTFCLDEEDIFSEMLKTFRILHTPGHSMGSCCFYTEYFNTPLLFAGDTLFQNSIGRTDLFGGDYNKIINSIRSKLFTLPPDTVVITGHGPLTTIGQEKQQNPYFKGA